MLGRLLKVVGSTLALCCAAPYALAYVVQIPFVGRDYAFLAVGQRVSRLPGRGGILIRSAVYRILRADIAPDVVIGFGALLTAPTVSLASRVYIGPYSVIAGVEIGPDTMIADNVSILAGSRQHGSSATDVPMRDQPGVPERIRVGRDCWIGSRSVVLAEIGDHSIVGAGSVVTRPVAPFQLVGGNPARTIRDRRAPSSSGDVAIDASSGSRSRATSEAP